MPNGISIVATSRYLYVSRADGSLVSRHLTIEDAIEAAVNAGVGEYTIVCPSRRVKVYGILPPTDPPTTPADLTVSEFTAGYVTLSWTASTNATLYQVYRDGVPTGTPTSGTTYTDSTVAPSTAYSYQVQASNGSGSSALSAAVPVTTTANSAPAWLLVAQTGLVGQAYSIDLINECIDDDNHALTFTLTSGSVPGLALSGSIYSGTPTTVGANSLTFSASDGYASTPITITFTVSDPDVTAPTVPTGVSAAVNGSTVTVSWAASTDASGVAHYRVYRDGVFRALSTASPYVESGVPVGSYSYTVSAVDSSTNTNESAQSSAAPATVVPQTPDTPINFTAVAASSTQINLSWAAGQNGAAPDDYDIDFSTVGASGPWTPVSIGLVTSYSHTGLTQGTTYYYRVKAKLGAAESGYANASAVPESQYWYPGHYMHVRSDVTTQSTRFSQYDQTATDQDITGCAMYWRWSWMESTRGNYTAGIALLRAEIEHLKALSPYPKRFILRLQDMYTSAYTPSNAASYFPSYFISGGFVGSPANKPTYTRWAKWDATAMGYFIDMLSAYATAFKDEPYLVGIGVFKETTTNGGWTGAPTVYSESLYDTQLRRMALALRTAWPRTLIWVPTNFGLNGTRMTDFIAYCESLGVGCGDPDADPLDFDTTVNVAMKARALTTPYVHSVDASTLGYFAVGDATAQEVYDYTVVSQRCHYMLWNRNTVIGTDAQRWYDQGTGDPGTPGGILDVIRSQPVLNTTKPTSFS